MQNKLQVDAANDSVTATTVADVHGQLSSSAYLPWAPVGSLIISLIAFLISYLAFRSTKKTSRQTAFDNHFANELRASLRKLDEAYRALRALTFPSASELVNLQQDSVAAQVKIEEFAEKAHILVAEIDATKMVRGPSFDAEFTSILARANLKLESASHPCVKTEIEFRSRVEAAKDIYSELANRSRSWLDDLRSDL